LCETAGVALLLKALRQSEQPAFLLVVGTCRVVAAALNRDPELMQSKVRAVLLNAGSAEPHVGHEYNVGMDKHAFIRVVRSALPIHWFPCSGIDMQWSDAKNRIPHNTYWASTNGRLLDGVAPELRAWFVACLSGSTRDDLISHVASSTRGRIDRHDRIGDAIMANSRQLWSTASLVLAAGRELVQTPDGWRFLPTGTAPAQWRRQPPSLGPITLEVSGHPEARTTWSPCSGQGARAWLFTRDPSDEHVVAMEQALNALLRTLCRTPPANP
jgi:hypothetical protein